MPFSFLPLGYDFADLAPAMSEKSARWHHDVVHDDYLAAIDRLLAPYRELAALTIEEVLVAPERIPDDIRDAARTQGGGHANHQFMWKILGKDRGTRPVGPLRAKIDSTYGGLSGFTRAFQSAALAHDGEGWAFLSLAKPRSHDVEILTTSGNGNVLELRKPGILICDLWEHAYRDDHNGDREAWLDAYLRVVDWEHCSLRYDRLAAGMPIT